MKNNERILIIGAYGPGNKLLSCALEDCWNDNIATAQHYVKAEPNIIEMIYSGEKYKVFFDSNLRKDRMNFMAPKDLAAIMESVEISGNTAILYTTEKLESLPYEIKNLIEKNKLVYILKSDKHFESRSVFEKEVLNKLNINF